MKRLTGLFPVNGLIAAAIAAALATVALWDTSRVSRAVNSAVATEKAEARARGIEANAKALAARGAADRPGAAQRVRQLYCRDC